MSTDSPTCSTSVILADEEGMHLRPAAQLVSVASQFDAYVVVKHNRRTANGKSLLDVLTLSAPPGARLTIFAKGGDAHKVIQAIKELFAGLFGGNRMLKGAVSPLPHMARTVPTDTHRDEADIACRKSKHTPAAPVEAGMKRPKQARKAQPFKWQPRSSEAPTEVRLAGNFNDWIPEPMSRHNHVFQACVELVPGTYQYKFVVDGRWEHDPAANEFIPDGFGAVNSVVRVG